MSNKVARTIYIPKDLDQYITERSDLTFRTKSATIVQMLIKCIKMEQEQDIALIKDLE